MQLGALMIPALAAIMVRHHVVSRRTNFTLEAYWYCQLASQFIGKPVPDLSPATLPHFAQLVAYRCDKVLDGNPDLLH